MDWLDNINTMNLSYFNVHDSCMKKDIIDTGATHILFHHEDIAKMINQRIPGTLKGVCSIWKDYDFFDLFLKNCLKKCKRGYGLHPYDFARFNTIGIDHFYSSYAAAHADVVDFLEPVDNYSTGNLEYYCGCPDCEENSGSESSADEQHSV